MIKVNDRWIIQVDENNYTVCRNKPKKNKNGSLSYPAEGYFRSLSEALQAISEAETRISLMDGEMSLAQAINAVNRTHNEMAELINAVLQEDTL